MPSKVADFLLGEKFTEYLHVLQDEVYDPTKFHVDQRNFIQIQACVWGRYRARWPRPGAITVKVCDFHQIWHVYQFSWISEHPKPLKNAISLGQNNNNQQKQYISVPGTDGPSIIETFPVKSDTS